MRTGQKQGEGDRRGPNGQSRRGVGSASGDKVGGGGPWEPRQTPSNALARLSTAEAPDAREGEGEGEGEDSRREGKGSRGRGEAHSRDRLQLPASSLQLPVSSLRWEVASSGTCTRTNANANATAAVAADRGSDGPPEQAERCVRRRLALSSMRTHVSRQQQQILHEPRIRDRPCPREIGGASQIRIRASGGWVRSCSRYVLFSPFSVGLPPSGPSRACRLQTDRHGARPSWRGLSAPRTGQAGAAALGRMQPGRLERPISGVRRAFLVHSVLCTLLCSCSELQTPPGQRTPFSSAEGMGRAAAVPFSCTRRGWDAARGGRLRHRSREICGPIHGVCHHRPTWARRRRRGRGRRSRSAHTDLGSVSCLPRDKDAPRPAGRG